ncbi:MAG TPA: hypothetical protein VMH77_01690 [Steroidobacteraceae bacterium]|nr:hypothetical protein [Steroidobacteraceae bacterium]
MQSSKGINSSVVALVACLLGTAAVPAEKVEQTPDFTGVWGTAGGPGIGGATRTAPRQAPKMKPEAQKRVDAYQKLTNGTNDSPYAWCTGLGMPASMMSSGGYPMEILQGKGEIIIIYEAMNEIRRVYFGDRNMAEADRVPSRNGYSSGHWEGDTLVIETDNLVDQVDQRGTSHSDQATIVERYHLDGKDAQGRRILAVEMTMTDPAFYEGPVVATKRWAEMPNGHALTYDCTESTWMDRVEQMAKEKGVPVP